MKTTTANVYIHLACVLSVTLWLPMDANSVAQVASEPAKTVELGDKKLKLAFFDDFENEVNKWQTADVTAWQHTEANGNHFFRLHKRKSNYQPQFRSPHNIALRKDKIVKDFVVKFDVRSTADTGNHRDCCVFFCYQNPNNFYYVHLGAKPDSASGQIMLVKEAPRTALTNNKKRVDWDSRWHKVMLTFDSDTGQIEVFFDDMSKPHMSVADKTFSSGRIGIGSFDDKNDFDNVCVYSN